LSAFSFDIKDYIEEGEVRCSASKTLEEPTLSAEIRDQLQSICDAKSLQDTFLAIRGELSQNLLAVLSPATFIEGHAPKVIQARQRLADREAQNTLDAREELIK